VNNIESILQEYLKHRFSLIPIKENTKKPFRAWKKYQYNRAKPEDILEWYAKYDSLNIAIVTGEISQLVVIDLDDPGKITALKNIIPEIEKTTKVYTPNRGAYHYYFKINGTIPQSTKNLFNLGIELHSNGKYIIAPPSKLNGSEYSFLNPLSKILPYPDKAINIDRDRIKKLGQEKELADKHTINLPQYNGQKCLCIKQIYQRDLKVGERNISLLILYNLLVQNNNTREHAQKLVIKKNNLLNEPLTKKEIANIFKKWYSFRCSKIVQELPYINCNNCKYKFKGGKLGMGKNNIIVDHISDIRELTPSEQRVLLYLGTHFKDEEPTQYEIAKYSGMNKNTVKTAVEGLREKGFNPPVKST
jgi:hypothetical protein